MLITHCNLRLLRTELEEVTIDSSASWKPVSAKQEIKHEDAESASCSGAPPAKRLKSVENGMASPRSITNPSTPGSYKPPTPAQSCTPNSMQGPKTPQQCHSTIPVSTSVDPKFAVPSTASMSQPQLLRQQSLPAGATNNRPDSNCHLAPSGECSTMITNNLAL